MAEARARVNHCIDTICQLGCDGVRNTIAAIEKGESPEQVNSLNSEDKGRVLTELKEIMAVYDVEDAGLAQK
ncbi:MAG: hypothetical protein GQ470_02400 [Gammaproteobacteria bacterium]|nr:hypothetical protein [Gammaproteobacteria bacterium]